MIRISNGYIFKNKLEEHSTVMIKFGANSWCAPCRQITPELNDLEKEISMPIYDVDIDENPSFIGMFNILGVPTTIIFKNGMEASRIAGFKSKDQLKEWVLENI